MRRWLTVAAVLSMLLVGVYLDFGPHACGAQAQEREVGTYYFETVTIGGTFFITRGQTISGTPTVWMLKYDEVNQDFYMETVPFRSVQ